MQQLRDASARRVALLVAPAGFGKSTALVQLLETIPVGSVHYRVPSGTATLAAFLRGLADAAIHVAPGLRQSFPIAYERAMRAESPKDVFRAWLIEHASSHSMTIAVDDLHRVNEAEIVKFLIDTIEASKHVSWILADRSPRFVVPKWLATGVAGMPVDQKALAFLPEEIERLAVLVDYAPRLGECARLATMTSGRASSVRLALASPIRRLSTRFLFTLSDPELFISASVFDELDLPMLRRAGWQEAGADVAALHRAGCIEPIADERYRWESGFHEMALAELRRRGDSAVSDAMLAAGEAFERSERYAEALRYYANADDREAMMRLLTRHGLALIDNGNGDIVRTYMDRFVGDNPRGAAPVGVTAALEAQIGHYDTADAWYRQAVASARDPEVRGSLIYRWSLDLLRRGKAECIELIEQYGVECGRLSPALLATAAAAHAMVGRLDEARRWAWRARELMEKKSPGGVDRARTLHQIAYVALRCGDYPEAKNFANEVAAIATHEGNYDLAARAYSILFEIAYAIECDPGEAHRYVDHVADNAMKSGDVKARTWGLLATLGIEADRGNVTALRAIEDALNEFDILQNPEGSNDVVLSVQAMRCAWKRDFSRAYHLIAESAEAQPTEDLRAMRFAEVALYAAAAGLQHEARAAIESSDWAARMGGSSGTRAATHSQAYLMLAAALVIGGSAARLRLAKLEEANLVLPASVEALIGAVREILAYWENGDKDAARLHEALAALRNAQLGGIARVLEVLPNLPSTPRNDMDDAEPRRTVIDEADVLLASLIGELSAIDAATAEHSRSVSAWCSRIATTLNLDEEEARKIIRAGLIFDIGKRSIPLDVLHANRALSDEEWRTLCAHPAAGERMIAEIPQLRELAPIVRSHHERYDGLGYPDGIARERIPIGARIIAVADAFNAMLSERPYRSAFSPQQAMEEIRRCKGTQFDPLVVDAMAEVLSSHSR
jgi:HD-GYP domain-containing protein (c-di-GMP phosphodiesterase class II)